MKVNLVKLVGVFGILLGALCVSAEPYRSLNEMCVVEKKGDGYWFLNGKELQSKSKQIFKTDRDQFEWFFLEEGKVIAKVYPALRDAVILAPDELYKQGIKACPLTDINKKLVESVSYRYNSKDNVCACLFEQEHLNCVANSKKLSAVPYEQLVLFFETEGFPSVIDGMVPSVLSKVWKDLPDDYNQRIAPCSSNTANLEIAKKLEPVVRNMRH